MTEMLTKESPAVQLDEEGTRVTGLDEEGTRVTALGEEGTRVTFGDPEGTRVTDLVPMAAMSAARLAVAAESGTLTSS